MDGLVNSLVFRGDDSKRDRGSPGSSGRCQANVCLSQGQMHLIWEKIQWALQHVVFVTQTQDYFVIKTEYI